jgi:hypothetical protein
MSCLAVSELSVSEQVELTLAMSDRTIARAAEVLATFDPRVPGFSPLSTATRPRGSNLPPQEASRMIERQLQNHPPLRVCNCIRWPHMYEARGNNAVRFYVECAPCEIRSPRVSTPEAAAEAWNARDLVPFSVQAVA